MLHTGSDIARRANADEIVGKRDQALALYAEGLATLAEAARLERDATHRPYDSLDTLDRLHFRSIDTEAGRASLVAKLTKKVDGHVWAHLVGAFGLANYMDAAAMAQFRDQLEKDAPAVTRETLRATFEQLFTDRDETFRRGVVNVFRKLDKDYRTNSAFKIRDRAVLSSILGTIGFNHYREGQAQLADLDRVFHMVDGKAPKDHTGDAGALVGAAWGYKVKKPTVETEYFEFRLFKNGNVHVHFKRADLVKEVNRIIAQHYGERLADDQHSMDRRAAR